MEASGLIEVSLGRNSQAIDFGGGQKPVYTPSLATRLKPTALMVSIAKEAGIDDQDATKHFLPQLPLKLETVWQPPVICGKGNMNQNFDKCMTMLLAHEGGYVNHPSGSVGKCHQTANN